MAKLNKCNKAPRVTNHAGKSVIKAGSAEMLRRSVNSCLLWEKTFYEDGVTIHDRIIKLVGEVDAETVQKIAIDARQKHNLRHVPLLVTRAMAMYPHTRPLVAETLNGVIQRPDEMSEFLALYWSNVSYRRAPVQFNGLRVGGYGTKLVESVEMKKTPVAAQVKKGLAQAFGKFDEYSLSKWNKDGAVKLRDVLFLSHPKPNGKEQADLWKRLVDDKLTTPDTWDRSSSAGEDMKADFERRLRANLDPKQHNLMPAMALIKNLRQMTEKGVDQKLIKEAIKTMNTGRVLPFRFITAAKYAPQFEVELEQAMFRGIEGMPKLPGKTVLLVDRSSSMGAAVSERSEMDRLDAANGVAMLARERGEEVAIYSFSSDIKLEPPRRGFALAESIRSKQAMGWTDLAGAVKHINSKEGTYDRIIVFTDEQSQSGITAPVRGAKGYIVNVATYENGVGYRTGWTTVNGFSESVIDWIYESELGEMATAI